jgi:putative hydrolase of the HAD superfamily
MTLRAVIFDYGHTLIHFERPEGSLLLAYREINQLLREELERDVPAAEDLLQGISVAVDRAIQADYAAQRLEEVEIASLYDAQLRRLGLELDNHLIERIMEVEQKAWLSGIELGPDVVQILSRIRAAGLRVGLVSNASYLPRLMKAQLVHLGVVQDFDALTWSSEVGFRKPHPAIYQDALKKLRVAPESVLFVGDRIKEDVQGPQSLGMRAALLREWRQEEDPAGLADFIIDRLGELNGILDRLLASTPATYNDVADRRPT